MEMKDEEFQKLRLRVDQISSELDKQDRVRAVNTKWMLTVGAFIVAALGYTNFFQLPKEAAKAVKEQIGPEIVEEANLLLRDLKGKQTQAKEIQKELENVSDLTKIANLPVGTIAASMLAPDEFAEAVGDPNRTTWVLADGNEVKTDSQYYQKYSKTRLPDLRGMFMRGLNEGRNDGKQDPDTRKPGDFQVDAIKSHKHRISLYTADTGTSGYRIPITSSSTKQDFWSEDQPGSSSETRPKNVAVYFYIKIN